MNKELNTQIPIYRAKKIDSDEYIIGYPINKTHMFVPDSFDVERSGTIGNGFEPYYFETLSINFSDMIDSEGTKIFASLSEDGKGGDKLTSFKHYFSINDCWIDTEETVIMEYGSATFDGSTFGELETTVKVTGIQE